VAGVLRRFPTLDPGSAGFVIADEATLAVVGLLTALLGGARDERAESDLTEQGVGPRGLRAELRARLTLASVLGVIAGLGIAVLLTRLAVATVRAAGSVADPSPPVVTEVPWAALAAWGAGLLAVLALTGWLASRALVAWQPGSSSRRPGSSGNDPAVIAQADHVVALDG